ncbi:MAG: riboflavin synthase [Betaproteobacteria bacterium]|nr:MAG: riboflavin synthase [Betaproteobacteria bacterium]
MFTGIIQAVGHIVSVTPLSAGGRDARVLIDAATLDLADVALGDSIAANGVCLTVVAVDAPHYSVDVSAETFACTTGFAAGQAVNLEKALRLSDRLGGHLVSGHVDGVGEVVRFVPLGESFELVIRAPEALSRYLAAKGSITVNGVSLTVNRVEGSRHATDFSLNLIPHTLENTMLNGIKAGDRVNLEADMLARYADRLMVYMNTKD